VRHVLIEEKAAGGRCSPSGGGARDGGRERLDSDQLEAAREGRRARGAPGRSGLSPASSRSRQQ
jgi:hypothetical protein